MNTQPENQNKKALNGDVSRRIPRRVWLAAGLGLVGAILTAAVAIVNGSLGGAAQLMWSVAAPCISIATMIAVVCHAIVKYR